MDVLIVKLKGSVILVLTLIMGVFVGTVYANEQEIDVQKLTVEEKLKLYNISRELDENSRRAPRKKASQSDIENEVAKFQEFDTGMKARTAGSNNALTKSVPVSHVDADLENRYMQDGKYIVTVHYYNDANYPEKYKRRPRFKENDSDIFFTQTSMRIFTDLLGSEYEKYEPKLGVVSDEFIGLKLLISNSEELEALISNPLVHTSRHVGRPSYIDTTRR